VGYVTRQELAARIGVDKLVGLTIGSFPDSVPSADFSATVLDPILVAEDRTFVGGLYTDDAGVFVLATLSDAQKMRYLDIHLAAHGFSLVDEAIEDAGAEIDGYLVERYRTPVDPAPKNLKTYCADLAVYNLLSRKGLNEDVDKDIVRRADNARAFLLKIGEGKLSLGIPKKDDQGAVTESVPLAPAGFRTRPKLDFRGY
jgi:phage gp36-like protein